MRSGFAVLGSDSVSLSTNVWVHSNLCTAQFVHYAPFSYSPTASFIRYCQVYKGSLFFAVYVSTQPLKELETDGWLQWQDCYGINKSLMNQTKENTKYCRQDMRERLQNCDSRNQLCVIKVRHKRKKSHQGGEERCDVVDLFLFSLLQLVNTILNLPNRLESI